jgi:hypothetical protein
MAVLSDSFGGIDVVASASGILRPYDNQGPTDEQSALILTRTTLSDSIQLTFNSVQTSTEQRTFITLLPPEPAIEAVGQQEFTTVGNSNFVVPAGVTSISAVTVGGGGGGARSTSGGSGAAGGDLRYSTSIAVTPGETITVTVGAAGGAAATTGGSGGFTRIVRVSNSAVLLSAAGGGGGRTTSTPAAQNGTSSTIAGNIGGGNGGRAQTNTATTNTSGGGGAGGYSGNGGNGGVGAVAGTAGAGGGGGGGGGAGSSGTAGNGGGVGILGAGANGTAGSSLNAGGAGSDGSGQSFGGGGRGSDNTTGGANGGSGGVRIIWGSGRQYPSTLTANQSTVNYVASLPERFGEQQQIVTLTNNISFPVGSFVKITDVNYSVYVEVTESVSGSIKFLSPPGFPTTLTAAARIEGASPSRYPQEYSKLRLLTTPRPYNFLNSTDYLSAAEITPATRSVTTNNRSINLEFISQQQDSRGRLSSANKIVSPEQDRKPEILNRYKLNSDRISIIDDIRPTNKIQAQDTSALAFWNVAGPTGILSKRGTTLTLTPGGKDVETIPFFNTDGALLPYNEPGLLDPDVFAVTAQDNITWSNSVDYFTYDLDILSIEISATGDFQTIYFSSNLGYPKLIFRVGDFAKLSYAEQNFEAVVEVLASTLNSITFQTVDGFPNNYQGGMTVQLATVFSYPKQRVFDQFIKESYPFKNISRPRENLFVSEYRPVQQDRTVSFFIGREFSDALPQLNSTTNKLNTFDTDSRLPADWVIEIIGENTEIKYNTQLWYREDLDIITFSTEPITEKILYFEDQETLLFKAGDTIRLYNPALEYSKFVEILAATSRSITIEVPENYPRIGNLFIENLTTSVYPQKFVSLYPGEPPKTPRDNLFYFEFLPTLRAPKLPVFFDTVGSELVTDFFKDNIRVTDVGLKLQPNAIEKDSVRVRAVTDNLTVSKLSAAVKVVADTVDRSLQRVEQFTSQLTVRPTTAPVNAAERFYYFNLTPGYRANRTIVQGSQLFQDSNNQPVEWIRSVTPLMPDRTVLTADIIDLYKIENFEIFSSPEADSLEKDSIKVISLDNLLFADRLSAAVKVIDAKIILSADTLKSSTTVRESQPFKDVNYVDKFLTKDYVDVGTVQTDFLSKDLVNLKESFVIISTNFLNKELVDLQETITIDDYGNLSAASILKESIPVDLIGNVRAMTILRSTNTFDIHEIVVDQLNNFEFLKLVVVPSEQGEIIKFTTRDYQDIAAPKKDPIQFWN